MQTVAHTKSVGAYRLVMKRLCVRVCVRAGKQSKPGCVLVQQAHSQAS